MPVDLKALGVLVNRDRNGRPQKEYARGLGLDQGFISKLERGEGKRLSHDKAEKLRARFGTLPMIGSSPSPRRAATRSAPVPREAVALLGLIEGKLGPALMKLPIERRMAILRQLMQGLALLVAIVDEVTDQRDAAREAK